MWDNGKADFVIISWNVNGVKNKMENNLVWQVLKQADIVFLNEIKIGSLFSLPGFKTYKSAAVKSNRGGCAMLIRNNLITNTGVLT